MKAISLKIAIFVVFLLTSAAAIYPSEVKAAVTIQIGMVLDASGSIGSGSWTIIVNGVASAVENNIPHDGTVELTVVQFGTGVSEVHGAFTFYARTEVAPTVITSANFATVANTIRAISQGGGSTPMADGIWVAWLDMAGSPNFVKGNKQVINIATDGGPNVRWSDTTLRNPAGSSSTDVTDARNAAVTAGLDELDGEGIGTGVNMNYLRDSVVWPQPGTIAPPFNAGWVQQVADAAAFAAAIGNKFQIIITPTPTPTTPTLRPVAGLVMPANKLDIIAPYLALTALALAVSAIVVVKGRSRD